MPGFLLCLLLAALFAVAGGVRADEKTLRIATGELPPYATASRSDQGIALRIVRRAFEQGGYRVEYVFLPWSRALRETRAGKWDATAYWGRDPARETGFVLTDTVLTEHWVFLHHHELDFDWQHYADLARWRLALIQDYSYTPEMRSMIESGELRGDPTPDDLTALRKLLRRRVDVVPVERNVACSLMLRHFDADQAAQLRAHPRPMTGHFPTHVMLPTVLPGTAQRLDAFNRGLRALQATGEYRRLRADPPCPYAWDGAAPRRP
ncbi:transporter substrate-binding domain-containing protein [Aquabacterium sp. A7-Y]|uniref:substrate-binding periplasmic protein n=1 Tax=Aquabacterium sp. A7-Y TaxID=1349605 RepID=UPI00223D33CC|nr:transporter substrate-binding domain-containing protein [Aquabacterium sp. A7-Y]MCW7541633.1 transporter substrate-binding domain-containing protein [Aquabacterium sp. A7-Y]